MSAALLRAIETGLERVGMAPSRFGREVVHDPRLVFDLRRGRCPTRRTEERVRSYLRHLQQESIR